MSKRIQKSSPATVTVVLSKASQVAMSDEQTPASGIQIPPISFSTIAELQSINTYHARCMNIKATITAGLGFDASASVMNEDFIKNHPTYAKQPITETLVNLQHDYEEFGNAFLEVVRNKLGEIAEIYHIPARYCSVCVDKETQEVYLQRQIGLSAVKWKQFGVKSAKNGTNEYLHIKNYTSTSVYYGAPEWSGAIGAIVLDRNGVEYNAAKFSNNGVPDFIVMVSGGELADGAVEQIQSFWQKNFKGATNAGKTLIVQSKETGAKIEVKELGAVEKEGSYSKLRTDARDEVVTAHGVPPLLLGISETGKLGGGNETVEQLRLFKKIIIDPKQARFEFVFNEILLPARNITDKSFKFKTIDLSDNANDATVIAALIPLGVLTAEEGRKMIGLEGPAPGKPAIDPGAMLKSLIDIRKYISGEVN